MHSGALGIALLRRMNPRRGRDGIASSSDHGIRAIAGSATRRAWGRGTRRTPPRCRESPRRDPSALPQRFPRNIREVSVRKRDGQRFRFGSEPAEMGGAWLEQATSCFQGASSCCPLLPSPARNSSKRRVVQSCCTLLLFAASRALPASGGRQRRRSRPQAHRAAVAQGRRPATPLTDQVPGGR